MPSLPNIITLFQAFAPADDVPEWVHLVPAGTFSGVDGRGPYAMQSPEVVVASLKAGDKLPIDENHSIDVAAPKGEPSPARGWIVELQSRADGVWGRVEWTAAGRALVADKAYRGISPALAVDPESRRTVRGVARASLVNAPNLHQLTSLHNRSYDLMDLTKLAAALGLAADASEAAILAAIGAQKLAITTHQAQTASVAAALGMADGATAEAVVVELQARTADAPKLTAVQAGLKAVGVDWAKATPAQIEMHLRGAATDAARLNATVVELQAQLVTLQADTAREKATQYVDGQIAAGKLIRSLRDHYIDRHMREPDVVKKELDALPSLHMPGRRGPAPGTGGDTLDAAEAEVCELMGLDPKAFAATKKKLEVI